MVFKSALSRPSKRKEALIDERTCARDDPLEVQAVESLYLHHDVIERFHLHKESDQQIFLTQQHKLIRSE